MVDSSKVIIIPKRFENAKKDYKNGLRCEELGNGVK
jgi:hypothetical protein